jgi:hypothetical protein
VRKITLAGIATGIGLVFGALQVPIFQGFITRSLHKIGWADGPESPTLNSHGVQPPDPTTPPETTRTSGGGEIRSGEPRAGQASARTDAAMPPPRAAAPVVSKAPPQKDPPESDPAPEPAPPPTIHKTLPGNDLADDRSCAGHSHITLKFSRSRNEEGVFDQVEDGIDIRMTKCSGTRFTAVFDTGATTSYGYDGGLTEESINFGFGYDQTYWPGRPVSRVKCSVDGSSTGTRNVYEGTLICHWLDHTLKPFGPVKIIVR